jgi:hypothetical protein
MLLMIASIKTYLGEIQLPLTEMIIVIGHYIDQVKLPVIGDYCRDISGYPLIQTQLVTSSPCPICTPPA